MKVTSATPVKPDVEITITHDEAVMLRAILFGIEWDSNAHGAFAEKFSDALSRLAIAAPMDITYEFSTERYLIIKEN